MDEIKDTTETATPSHDDVVPGASKPIEDRAQLESKTETALRAVFGDEGPGETPAVEEKQEVTPATEVSAEAETKETDETPGAVDQKVNTSQEVQTNSSSTLPAAYVRSLKAYDWTDEEIAEAARQPNFVATAAKIHANRNREVSQWAEAGQRARQSQTQTQDAPATSVTNMGLTPVDVATLKKQYGEDKLIDALAGPVNAAVAKIQEILPMIQESQKVSNQAKMETLGKQIETFFTGKEMEPYKDLYGSAKTGLQDTNLEARNKVLRYAGELVDGARVNGRNLSLDDALTLAHDSVSSGFKEQAVRSTIKTQMKTRERGISLKPGGKTTVTAASGEVTNRKELERKVGAGLASVFKNS